MQEILTELILDFYAFEMPEIKRRTVEIREMPRNASVIVGMRRTGKTFRVYQKIRELLAGGIPLDRILYLNLDDDRLHGMTLRDLSLIPEIFYRAHPENREQECYFFLDEIQDVEGWEIFARRLIDSGKIRLYLTGSSAKLLSREIASTLRGRAVETEVFPLSFREFLRFHGIMEEIPELLGGTDRIRILNALDRYFQIGGFPEVQTCSPELWAEKLQGYANEVLFRDVVERCAVTNIPALKYLLLKICHNPCGKLSASAVHRELKAVGIRSDREKIGNYIDCFSQANLLYPVRIHSDSLSQKQVNPPKIYLADIGLVRAMNSKQSADRGHLLENLVFLHLRRRNYEVEYLVTQDGYEVDFAAWHKFDREYHLVQVCYDLDSPTTMEREVRALRSAAQTLRPADMTIVTWNGDRRETDGIRIVPVWQFLLDRVDGQPHAE